MTVFISYRHTDRGTALAIAEKLNANKVSYYLDVVDDESKSTEDITEVITKNIKKSSHLLAVISSDTGGSWWVPFEIGEATIANRRICSYITEPMYTNLSQWSFGRVRSWLPDYLKKWPMLFCSSDLEEFIKQYKVDNAVYGIKESQNRQFDSINRNELTKAGADAFHSSLKNRL